MPQFVLNDSDASPAYEGLSTFAKAYVEAMFFTNGDTGDDDDDSLNRLGVDALTAESVQAIAAVCDWFRAEHASDLEEAAGLEPGEPGLEWTGSAVDDERAGHCLWYCRQGHGVAYSDDGTAAVLERLDKAASDLPTVYVDVIGGRIHVSDDKADSILKGEPA